MSKKTKKWLIIAGSLVILGLIMFAVVMAILKWDFTKLSTMKIETNTYQVTEVFSNMSIKTDTADIGFAVSDDGKCKVVCNEMEKVKHSVSIQNGTLSISSSTGNVELPRNIKFKSVYITEDYSIERTTGNVKFDSCDAREISIRTSTGNISGTLLSEKLFIAETSTGNVDVPKTTTGGKCELKTSTGNIKVDSVP